MSARIDVRYAVAQAALRTIGYESRRIESDDGTVHVLEGEGEGRLPSIVLLHGLGSSGLDYLPLMMRLRKHTRSVIAPDLLGHGLSGEPRGAHEIGKLWRSLAHALESTLDGPAIVFGNSLGGLAALRLGVDWPHLAKGLFLASPAGAPSSEAEARELRETFELRSHADALRLVDGVVVEPSRLRHAMALGVRRRFIAPTPRAIIARLDGTARITPEELATLEMPIRLLWGRSERILPETHLEFFRAHLPPHFELEHAHGFGHSPQLDNAELVANRIIAFAKTLG